MLLDLARSLELTVVAEGIETPEQAERLLGLGAAVRPGLHLLAADHPRTRHQIVLPDILLKGRPVPVQRNPIATAAVSATSSTTITAP